MRAHCLKRLSLLVFLKRTYIHILAQREQEKRSAIEISNVGDNNGAFQFGFLLLQRTCVGELLSDIVIMRMSRWKD